MTVIDLPHPERVPRRPDGSINVEQLEREWRRPGFTGGSNGSTHLPDVTFVQYLAAIIEREWSERIDRTIAYYA